MLRRFGSILAISLFLLGLPAAPLANARVIVPQQCTSTIGDSSKTATIKLWKKKKCKPAGTGTGSGGGGSSDSSSTKSECPLAVRLSDGSCPEAAENGLPQPAHQLGTLVPDNASLVAALRLPDATPRFGPDPSVNEWNMLVVGFPIWLWTDGPRVKSAHVRRGGLDFAITATWQSSRFTMGDGQVKTCGAMSEYRQGIEEPGRPSPTCGYVYEETSPKGRPYVVVAEETWRIDWTSGADRGSFVHSYQGSRTLEIGELSSLIKG